MPALAPALDLAFLRDPAAASDTEQLSPADLLHSRMCHTVREAISRPPSGAGGRDGGFSAGNREGGGGGGSAGATLQYDGVNLGGSVTARAKLEAGSRAPSKQQALGPSEARVPLVPWHRASFLADKRRDWKDGLPSRVQQSGKGEEREERGETRRQEWAAGADEQGREGGYAAAPRPEALEEGGYADDEVYNRDVILGATRRAAATSPRQKCAAVYSGWVRGVRLA